MLLSVTEFFSKTHPLIVHLPIGILLVSLFIQWLSSKSKYHSLKPAVPVLLLCGAVTALISCITGYMLSVSFQYDKTLLNWHLWTGIGVAFISMLLYIKVINNKFDNMYKLLSVFLFALVIAAGYLGGKLAHRPDHFIKPVIQNNITSQP